MPGDQRQRNDYAPTVRPRAARQDGLRRYTPGYLMDLSDTQTMFFSDFSRNTTRQTLLRPRPGKRLRLINLTIYQTLSDYAHYCEVYFGMGRTIASAPRKAVDYVRVPDHGSSGTRTWGRGAGPAGERNEPLSIRWVTSPSTSHKFIVEYTEER
ncbi:MAG: hypothetical protein OXE50_07480 [Chloroflexi bacterium]|nr:hypothetical protein [Chloroflexota bacterium]